MFRQERVRILQKFYISGNHDNGIGDSDVLRTLSSGPHRKLHSV